METDCLSVCHGLPPEYDSIFGDTIIGNQSDAGSERGTHSTLCGNNLEGKSHTPKEAKDGRHDAKLASSGEPLLGASFLRRVCQELLNWTAGRGKQHQHQHGQEQEQDQR